MKKFEAPEIEISAFAMEDVLTTSGDNWDVGEEPL